ncbi:MULTISPECIES: sirohydrochlorin chelatase [Bacillus cereus group]|uniref:Cobalamin biosynthesis protein CbiX n=1 Tax=Bacillus cereus TaxID=1396 RepID=A0A2B8TK87_BACCE|nr:sirohydrochlorin chelatase [Bacillus cereus]PDY81220.1 cobalamin biosynthesis protein CbiX [Bacillus cereus]PFA15130.1 cobalamin biosynthesis protein CbiX [Bacillus cereus]PFM42856.1 cobalamin biosynthesis protein CbiX [Bacillus cereus]PGL65215.1 cobalamin biosynthesis protein CbiX [Bacillus cereus]PGQ10992.1 cobalamin biosynthesis protein CbiX [Bacillus cereus]
MKAVLYICHGSRLKAAKEEAVAFITSCMNRVEAKIQEVCFLELASPSIEEGFRTCVKRGATEIVAIPVFLLAAGHVKKDIPLELRKLNEEYPDIKIVYGNPFGVSEVLVKAVYNGSGIKDYEEEVTLLLVARGSSDPETLQDMKWISSLFQKEENIKEVEICYLAAAEPKFEEKLREVVEREEKSIVVLPYLLFTGLLMKHVEKEVLQYELEEIKISPYLGKNEAFREMLIQKTEGILEGEQYVSTYSAS